MIIRPAVFPACRTAGPASAEIFEMMLRSPHMRFDMAWRRASRDDKRLARMKHQATTRQLTLRHVKS